MNDQPTATLVEEQAGRPVRERNKRPAKRRRKEGQRLFDDFAHDVRTPLTVINEYVSLLSDGLVGSNDNEQRQILDVIADRLDDLNHAFDDVLDAMKLATQSLNACRRKCRVADIVARVRPILERKAAVMHGQLEFDVPGDLPDVYCDIEQIGRVVVSLTTHALKCCRQQGTVLVWAKRGDCRNEIVVGVTESSRDIPPAETVIDRQHMTRADGSCGSDGNFARKLQVVRDLVRLNLGEIEAVSTGKGTTFRFGVPVVDPTDIVARYLKRRLQRPSCQSTVSFVKVRRVGTINGKLERETDSLLGMLLQPNDLILQVDQGLWLIALCRKRPDPSVFLQRMERLREAVNRKRCREPLPTIVAEPLGTWRTPDGVEPILATIGIAFGTETGSKRENPA